MIIGPIVSAAATQGESDFGTDPRTAAEIMTTQLWASSRTRAVNAHQTAGPLARQVFDAAVMLEQVDPR